MGKKMPFEDFLRDQLGLPKPLSGSPMEKLVQEANPKGFGSYPPSNRLPHLAAILAKSRAAPQPSHH